MSYYDLESGRTVYEKKDINDMVYITTILITILVVIYYTINDNPIIPLLITIMFISDILLICALYSFKNYQIKSQCADCKELTLCSELDNSLSFSGIKLCKKCFDEYNKI